MASSQTSYKLQRGFRKKYFNNNKQSFMNESNQQKEDDWGTPAPRTNKFANVRPDIYQDDEENWDNPAPSQNNAKNSHNRATYQEKSRNIKYRSTCNSGHEQERIGFRKKSSNNNNQSFIYESNQQIKDDWENPALRANKFANVRPDIYEDDEENWDNPASSQNNAKNSHNSAINQEEPRNIKYRSTCDSGYEQERIDFCRRNLNSKIYSLFESGRLQEIASGGRSKEIYIPTKSVGRVIGRGGVKIMSLQENTECKIMVTKNMKGENTLIKLIGNNDQIAKAEESILDTIKERYVPEEEPNIQNSQDLDTIHWKQSGRNEKERKLVKLGQIVKMFYEEAPEISVMSEKEVEILRKEKNIVVQRVFEIEGSAPIPKPIKTFEQAFHNYPRILDAITKVGFTEPSPIQCQAWPILMSGEDMIGISQTLTGKTLAFLLPALIHMEGQIKSRKKRNGPSVLILAPTRDLAQQIEREVNKYCYNKIKAVCVCGGGSLREQIYSIESHADIIIGTPRRMNDLYMKLNIKNLTYVVLDEADRMLNMGFEPQVRNIMGAISPDRQTVITSATSLQGLRDLAQSYMVNPIQLCVGSLELAQHNVMQTIHMVEQKDKYQSFLDFILCLRPGETVICYLSNKISASRLSSDLLVDHDIASITLHEDLKPCDREQSLAAIKEGKVQILITTDLAAKGIDIDHITHVINYDFPKTIDEYVHRVGRIGRAGQESNAISFFTRNNWAQAQELIQILQKARQYVPVELHRMAERFEAKCQLKQYLGDGCKGRYPAGGNCF